jgi:hypothetical protein
MSTSTSVGSPSSASGGRYKPKVVRKGHLRWQDHFKLEHFLFRIECVLVTAPFRGLNNDLRLNRHRRPEARDVWGWQG